MGEFRYVGTDTLIARGVGAVREAVVGSAEDLVAEAMAATPVRTGTLKGSIHAEDPEETATSVSVKVATGGEASDYAIFVHEGTAAHEIVAPEGKVLAFNGHFAKRVHHPGTKPYKYIERPLIENRAVYLAAMQRAARGAY